MKKMFRKAIAILLTCGLLSCIATPVFAKEEMELTRAIPAQKTKTSIESNSILETLQSTDVDYEEISGLASEIMELINGLILRNSEKKLEIQDIDFDQMLKIYVPQQDILAMNTSEADIVIDALNNDIYMYITYLELPAGKYAEIQISKALPLSEELKTALPEDELAELQAKVGHWQVASVGEIDKVPAYLDAALEAQKTVKNSTDIRIVGGLRQFHNPVVLTFSENKVETLSTIYGVSLTSTWENLNSIAANNTDLSDGVLDFISVVESLDKNLEVNVISVAEEDEQVYSTQSEIQPFGGNNTYWTLNVTREKQFFDQWCWAAVARMIGNYFLNGNAPSQHDISQKVHNNILNQTASLQEIEDALKYATNNRYTFVASSATVISYNTVRTTIRNNKPLAIRMDWRNGTGHVLVISGCSDRVGQATERVQLIDPYENTATKWYSYADLKADTTLATGTGYLSHIFYY